MFRREFLLDHWTDLWLWIMAKRCCNIGTNFTAICTVYSKASGHSFPAIWTLFFSQKFSPESWIMLCTFNSFLITNTDMTLSLWLSESQKTKTFRLIQLMICFTVKFKPETIWYLEWTKEERNYLGFGESLEQEINFWYPFISIGSCFEFVSSRIKNNEVFMRWIVEWLELILKWIRIYSRKKMVLEFNIFIP